jgi:hypothetical protein
VIRALTVATLALGLAIAGCGSDDSGDTTTAPTVSIPPITSPLPATTVAPTATATTPTGTTRNGNGNGNGGSGPPSAANPNQPDSATNDVPPPAGSPQESFEKQCEQNPRACR